MTNTVAQPPQRDTAPAAPAATSSTHPSIQTTSSELQPAPGNLMVKGYNKRSLAALETEFVDNNDMDAMAPSSAVLQSDFLILDDSGYLSTNRRQILVDVPSPVAPALENNSPRPLKKHKAVLDGARSPADLTALGPMDTLIEPSSSELQASLLSSSSSLLSSQTGVLLPLLSSSARPSVVRPRRNTLSALLQKTSLERPESEASDTDASATASPLPGHQTFFMAAPSRRRSIAGLVHKISRQAPYCPDESQALQEYGEAIDFTNSNLIFTPDHENQEQREARRDAVLERQRNKQKYSLREDDLPPARDESVNVKDWVKMKDAMEVEAQPGPTTSRLQPKVGDEDDEGISSSDDLQKFKALCQGPKRAGYRQDDGVVLPIEEWDPDDLQDESRDEGSDNDGSTSLNEREEEEEEEEEGGVLESDGVPSRTEKSKPETITRGGDPFPASSSTSSSSSSFSRSRKTKVTKVKNIRFDRDDGDSDPEREIPVVSEDQENGSYDTHLRLETIRDFQDSAGLDLGEQDAESWNEEGRYGGAIEDDDQGDDYWENR